MRPIPEFVLILFSASAFAGSVVPIEKAKSFLSTKCTFAAAALNPKQYDKSSSMIDSICIRASQDENVLLTCSNESTEAFCVTDITNAAGTVNEAKGCAAGYLNLDTGNFNTVRDGFVPGQACSKDLVLKILTVPVYNVWSVDGMSRVSIKGHYKLWLYNNVENRNFYWSKHWKNPPIKTEILVDEYGIKNKVLGLPEPPASVPRQQAVVKQPPVPQLVEVKQAVAQAPQQLAVAPPVTPPSQQPQQQVVKPIQENREPASLWNRIKDTLKNYF